ncbi:MAG: hypothetical protein SFY69_09005 [Planctomycetota bacterium]|nr:hypothetical protein [Planctomycetota bacterium]
MLALASPVRVRIARDVPTAPSRADDEQREWDRHRAANPALFDGPILSVVSIDADTGEILVRRESYRRLVVQPRVATGVRLLAVTGLLTAHDDAGAPHVLLGRRAESTRAYPGMWEIGPSGGVGVPPASVEELLAEHLTSYLADEASEEVGLDIEHARAVAIVRDEHARSDDIVLAADMGPLSDIAPRTRCASWEYTQLRWIARRDVPAFVRDERDAIIPPTLALLDHLGWSAPGD